MNNRKQANKNSVILIPALDPDRRLISYVEELLSYGFKKIILVDDGSKQENQWIFSELINFEAGDIILLRHAVNLGKGRALKNGINCFLNQTGDEWDICKGLITVDSDGQHLVEDIIKIDEALQATEGKGILLGCRNFDGKEVPFKSSFGNKSTRIVFRLCFGRDIIDTQTGLRAFTKEVLSDYLDLFGERFEYETNVLIESVRKNINIQQIPITTVYENKNEGTHFNPITDSIKIYKLILGQFFKYIIASLLSFVIDITLFEGFFRILPVGEINAIWIATIAARVFSSFFNYLVNRKVVFNAVNSNKYVTLIQYYTLCIITICLSSLGVSVLYHVLCIPEIIAKCIVDSILFLCNYKIQQKWIFRLK